MATYFMGVDNGGSMVKAVIFDELGSEVASSSARLTMLTPQAGFTERDMDELWRINWQGVRGALCEAGDVLLIAGKGHETTQEIAGVKHPFDDRRALRAAFLEEGA